MDKINQLKKFIRKADNIVFLGGAGVSTESGIPDFRGKEGLYKYSPEIILSHEFFLENSEEFFEFYRKTFNYLKAEPNRLHYYFDQLQKIGKLKHIITQNVDGLHQKAGSINVIELHGSIHTNYCTRCKKIYNSNYIFNTSDIPKCSCGGIIRPDIVLYGENLKKENITKARNAISSCDLLIVGGTSLEVYPAAGLLKYLNSNNLVIINKENTSKDNIANLVVNANLGDVFEEVMKQFK